MYIGTNNVDILYILLPDNDVFFQPAQFMLVNEIY